MIQIGKIFAGRYRIVKQNGRGGKAGGLYQLPDGPDCCGTFPT